MGKLTSGKQAALVFCYSYSGNKQLLFKQKNNRIFRTCSLCFSWTEQLFPHLRWICQMKILIRAINCGLQSAVLSVPVLTILRTVSVAVKIVKNGKCFSKVISSVFIFIVQLKFQCDTLPNYICTWGYLFLFSQKIIKAFAVQFFHTQKSG